MWVFDVWLAWWFLGEDKMDEVRHALLKIPRAACW